MCPSCYLSGFRDFSIGLIFLDSHQPSVFCHVFFSMLFSLILFCLSSSFCDFSTGLIFLDCRLPSVFCNVLFTMLFSLTLFGASGFCDFSAGLIFLDCRLPSVSCDVLFAMMFSLILFCTPVFHVFFTKHFLLYLKYLCRNTASAKKPKNFERFLYQL